MLEQCPMYNKASKRPTVRWVMNWLWSFESRLPTVSKTMTVSALTSARTCRTVMMMASFRTSIEGTRFGVEASTFRRSRG